MAQLTLSEVLKNNPTYKTLINAVINRIGVKSVSDVNSHGIDGGFNGFIYCSDTHKFAMKYRAIIVKLLEDSADQLNEEIVDMVSHFGVFRNSPIDAEDKKDLYKYIGGGRPQQGTITNVMAWFAAEEVCRMFDN